MPATAVRRARAERLADTLLRRHPIGPLEAAVATGALLIVAFTVFGSHIVNGGFIMDDWSNQAKSRYLASCCGPGATGIDPGFAGVVRNMLSDGPAGYHLGLTVIAPLVHYFLGFSLGLHLAFAAALGAVMSAAFYVVVRLIGLERLPAAAIAVLVLVFPFSDSTRLWAMASFNQIAVILWLIGVMLAFAGLRQAVPRRAALFHAGALALYAMGTLTYEQVGGAVLVSVAFYLAWGARGRQAAVRWVADAAVAGISLYLAATQALPRGILSWGDRFDHAWLITKDAFTLMASVFAPFLNLPTALVAVVVFGIVALAALRRRGLPGGDPERAGLTRWLGIAAAGVGGIATGYLLIIPSTYGSPLDLGIENRTNMLAAFGWIAFLYAVAMLAGLLGFARAGRPTAWAPVVPAILCLVVGIGYVARIADSSADYDRSFAEQLRVLKAVGANGPYREGSTIYTFGHPTYVAQGVPVFSWVWDQNPAVKVWQRDPSLASFPMLPGTTFKCKTKSLYPLNPFGFGEGQAARYGRAYFVDTERDVFTRIDDREDCLQARERYAPGPLVRGRDDCGLLGGGPATRLRWACSGRLLDGI